MILLLGVLAGLTQAQTSATAPARPGTKFVESLQAGKPQKIVFFGTSLTQVGPWVKQVAAALDEKFPKLVTSANTGKSGENSTWGLANVQKAVIDETPDLVLIEFTTNDAVDRFHMSVADARKNIESIIDKIQKACPNCEIVLQTMNPVIGHPVGDRSHRSDLPAYQQMYRDVGKQRGLKVIDHTPAWQAVLDKGEDQYRALVPDGLHPGAPGCAKIVTPAVLAALGVPEGPKK